MSTSVMLGAILAGARSRRQASGARSPMATPVTLHVYDLSQGMARALSMQFLGIHLDIVPHTGIVVYGKEYFFSGGIQSVPAHLFAATYHTPVHEVVQLGSTEIPKELFEEFLEERSPDFTAATYSLLHHNCNHFTDECANFLLGKSIPQAILDVPTKVLSSPMGPMFSQMFEGSANAFDPLAQAGAVREQLAATSEPAVAAEPAAANAPPPPPPEPPTPIAPTPATQKNTLPAATPATRLMKPENPPSAATTTAAATPSVDVSEEATPARPAPPLATPATTANGNATNKIAPPSAAITSAAKPTTATPILVTPSNLVTPNPPTPLLSPNLFPSRKPLTSAAGQYTTVLKVVEDAIANPTAAFIARFGHSDGPLMKSGGTLMLALRAALGDPNLIDEESATKIAYGMRALLKAWPPPDTKHFALLYMARLLCAASEEASKAMIEADLPGILLNSNNVPVEKGVLDGVLDSAENPLAAARGARIMGLALLANLAARPQCAARLIERTDMNLIISAASRALSMENKDVSQMGGALSHNLALALTAEVGTTTATEHMAPLLFAALEALTKDGALADTDAFGRALSTVGHLLAPKDDEAFAVALSLDAPATLSALKGRADKLGHTALLEKVQDLLSI